jgi:hypothetical protein
MKRSVLFLSAMMLSSMVAFSQAGTWKIIGTAGSWVNTAFVAGAGSSLYTIENSGALYNTAASVGTWVQIGKPDYGNTAFLFASSSKLYTIEKDGTLYEIVPSTGVWKTIGNAGAWIGTMAGVVMNDALYTIEKSGALYKTVLSTGAWTQVGKAEFANTKYLLAGSSKLYTIETSGTIYQIDPSTGAWKQIGASGAWKGTTHAATIGDKLYTIETSNGAFYETDLTIGTWKQIGKADYANTKFITAANSKIYTIEKSGTLYEINVK